MENVVGLFGSVSCFCFTKLPQSSTAPHDTSKEGAGREAQADDGLRRTVENVAITIGGLLAALKLPVEVEPEGGYQKLGKCLD